MKYFPDNNNYSLKEFTAEYTSNIKNVFDDLEDKDLEPIFEALSDSILSKKTIYTIAYICNYFFEINVINNNLWPHI